ncbi:hypothetical protein HDU97_007340 [Phlyctochytrium planicorne]|nr:hypothetical protein HDU97_007340 [Phlyctochytrium planicorne]
MQLLILLSLTSVFALFGSASPLERRIPVCDEDCAQIFDPVCGTDGVTYSNACELSVHNCKTQSHVQVASHEECAIAPVPRLESSFCNGIRCSMEVKPVCGSNGETFRNECFFSIAHCKNNGLTKTADVACDAVAPAAPSACDAIKCTMQFSPVCGSDGQTFQNECFLTIAACKNASIVKVADAECN